MGWLSRWFGRSPSPAPAPAVEPGHPAPPAARDSPKAPPPSAPGVALPASTAQGAAPAGSTAQATIPVARHLLIDRNGRLAGFEFPLPDVMRKRLAQGAGDVVIGAHARAFLAALRPVADSGRVAMASLPGALLQRDVVALEVPPKAWLVVPSEDLTEPPPAWWSPLKERSVNLGTEQVPSRRAAFVRIDCSTLDRDAAIAAVMACREAAPKARVVASQLADVDDVEAVLRAGADLASGRHEHMRQVPQGATLSPAMAQVSRLMNQVLHDADLTVIAAGIREDVGLSYELLRFANSPMMGLQRQVDAVDQAVLLLGRDPLFRWLCARLLAANKGRASARALQEIALARASLFERLAPAAGAPPATLFTLGLLSLVDVMVPMPMAEAVAPLRLPEDVRAALVDRQGPWAPLLELAQALERGDTATAQPLAAAFGGLDEVAAAAEQAWAYAGEAAAALWSA